MKLREGMEVKNNELFIGGVSTLKLAKEFGTPLYVMDEGLIRKYCQDYYKTFKVEENHNHVVFAGKAFMPLAMCELVKQEGLCLDVVSGGELYTAQKCNFPMDRIYLNGNNKSLEEVQMGVDLGVGRFVVDNIYEIYNINANAKKRGKTQKVLLRITPGISAHTHKYIKTGQYDSKFGFTLVGNYIIDTVRTILAMSNIEIQGLHCHIGSQILETQPYVDAADVMLTLIRNIKDETGYVIKELDLGGGFGVYYSDGDDPKESKLFCNLILDEVDKKIKELHIDRPALTIEPGRSIVGNAGSTLYTIGSKKEIPGMRKYVAVDGGMTDNIRPALYQAKYECAVCNKVESDEKEKVTIAGKCCESGDILIEDVELPKLNSGDVLAIFTTGAYGYSMANNYNKIPKPAVVFVKDGQAKLVCKRESYEDIIKNELPL